MQEAQRVTFMPHGYHAQAGSCRYQISCGSCETVKPFSLRLKTNYFLCENFERKEGSKLTRKMFSVTIDALIARRMKHLVKQSGSNLTALFPLCDTFESGVWMAPDLFDRSPKRVHFPGCGVRAHETLSSRAGSDQSQWQIHSCFKESMRHLFDWRKCFYKCLTTRICQKGSAVFVDGCDRKRMRALSIMDY
jgi:hypothetical protein